METPDSLVKRIDAELPMAIKRWWCARGLVSAADHELNQILMDMSLIRARQSLEVKA